MFRQKLLSSSVNLCTKRWKLNCIISRKLLIMINSDNNKSGKAWKCENEKDSFRFTWCNCWFKEGCSLWIWIASFILSWKLVEAWSKIWKLSVEHKARQCGESFRCLKMWEAWKNAGRFHRRNRHYSQHIQTYKPHVNGARQRQGLSHRASCRFWRKRKQA